MPAQRIRCARDVCTVHMRCAGSVCLPAQLGQLQRQAGGLASRTEALAQVVVPQCEAAACNLRTRCRLTNQNTPFEGILRGDSSFGIRSRSFGRAVSVFSIRCNQPSSAALQKVDGCATEACARSARLAAQMEAARCPRPLPSPVPALASLGALLSHVLGSPWSACCPAVL